MSEVLAAPTDDLGTGIPLPIIPSEKLPNIPPSSPESTGHHEFYLPGKERFRTLGEKTVRSSRVLRVEREVHNTGPKKFHIFFKVSQVPVDEQARANLLVLTLAGYIPKEGVDLWSGEPKIREMEDGEREILCEEDPDQELTYKNLRCERVEASAYIRKIVLKQTPGNVDPDTLKKFISARSLKLTKGAGHQVLRSAVQSMVEPIASTYEILRGEDLLHPLAPISAEDMVLHALGNEAKRENLLYPLRERLSRRELLAA